jgi:hypothetical protein
MTITRRFIQYRSHDDPDEVPDETMLSKNIEIDPADLTPSASRSRAPPPASAPGGSERRAAAGLWPDQRYPKSAIAAIGKLSAGRSSVPSGVLWDGARAP